MLFKTIQELMRVSSAANSNINFASIKPKLDDAAIKYLVPITGQPLLQYMAARVKEAAPPAENIATLLQYMQAVQAAWALYHYIPIAEVSITDGGVFRSETDNSKTAYQAQVTNLRRELMAEAYAKEENLINYLFGLKPETMPENPTEGSDAWIYATFTGSPQFARYHRLIVASPSAFAELIYTPMPGRNSHALRPRLYDVQQLLLPGLISQALYQKILGWLKTQTGFTEDEMQYLPTVLEYAGKWLVYTTLHRSLAAHSMALDERGLTQFLSSSKATHDDDSKRGSAAAEPTNHLATEMAQQAEEWKEALSFYLQQYSSNLVFNEYYTWWAQKSNPQELTVATPEHINDNTYGFF